MVTETEAVWPQGKGTSRWKNSTLIQAVCGFTETHRLLPGIGGSSNPGANRKPGVLNPIPLMMPIPKLQNAADSWGS